MNMLKKSIWALLIALLMNMVPYATFAQEPAYESAHFRFYFDDPSLKEKVSALAEERESFFQFLKGLFPQAKDPGKIDCQIYTSWEEAYEKSAKLKEGFVYNIYQEGIFIRSEDIALMVKISLGESASFLQSGLVKLLWDQFRGLSPHSSTLLLLKENRFFTPYDMMYRPYSLYATCTFSSFLAFLWEKYGQEKLLQLLAGIKDYMLSKGQSYLIPKTIQQVYGKSIDQLTQEWKAYLLTLPQPPFDSKSYAAAAEFINRAGAEFYLWMDFPNFVEILKNYGTLYFYFDSFDMEKTSLWLERTEEIVTRSEKAWKSLRNPGTYLIWGGIALGIILFGVALYFIIMGQINKRKVLALRQKRDKEEKNYEEFLEKRLKG
ncbi:MAG: hypothetical protein NUV70_00955 [Caldiserica bacterium]|jgi:hypothetical protein|nr:hypothetical protein [Caldisericota bacterium]